MKINVKNMANESVKDITLADTVWNIETNDLVLKKMIRLHLDSMRQGTHKTKTRSEVSGCGRKPWKQKGTGRARQGSIRATQWRGGGIAGGVTPRDYTFDINKKERALALKSALTHKAQDKELVVIDNIKLEKGLYSTSKGFTASLEELDPSENYIGTDYEGLDAYQRQLKRFDIKVSGAGSDTISKFFKTTDSAALFPEYISRAVQQGLEEEDILPKIIAATTNIDALDYRAIESIPSDEDKELQLVGEGELIPETNVKTKDKLTKLKKRGRMLVASYEAIKFQKLDLFTVTLKQIGAYIARTQFNDAMEVLEGSGIENISGVGAAVSYADLVKLWDALSPYNTTTLIAAPSALADMLSITEFKDSYAGQNFHGTGKMITPFGAEVLKMSGAAEKKIIALDKNAALEKVQAGGILTEYDKLIDRQLERCAITAITGFSTIFGDAAKMLAY